MSLRGIAPACRTCDASLYAAALPGGGRIGWVCVECDAFYPDDSLAIRDPLSPEEASDE